IVLGRRNEVGAARRLVVASYPVLRRTKLAAVSLVWRASEQRRVDRADVADRQGARARAERDRLLHRTHIPEYVLRARVGLVGIEGGTREPTVGHLEALDAGRCHRLGAQELARQSLQRPESGRARVQVAYSHFGLGHDACYVGGETWFEIGDRVRQEGVVIETLAATSASEGALAGSPPSPFKPFDRHVLASSWPYTRLAH